MGDIVFVEHAEAAAVVVKQSCQSCGIELCSIYIVGELKIHASWVKVLISAESEISLLGQLTRKIHIEVLCAVGIGLIFHLSLEFLATALHI